MAPKEDTLPRWLRRELKGDLKKVDRALAAFLQEEQDPLIAETGRSLLKAGGKRIRPLFVLLSGKLFSYRFEALLPLAMAIELLHMASLVHDDVVDAAPTRRGQPSIPARWGNTFAVNTGSFFFARAIDLILQVNNPQIISLFAKMCVDMARGEIQQLQAAFDANQTFKNYYHRIRCKTALLISLSCQVGAIASQATEHEIWTMKNYGRNLGIAFQIVDDLLDLTADPQRLGKPLGGDIRQGVMTLPMIYALQDLPQRQKERLHTLLAQKDKAKAEVEEVMALIKKSKAIQRAQDLARAYTLKAKSYLTALPWTPQREMLAALATYLGERSS